MIEVDVELIAGQRPTVHRTSHRHGRPRVHQVQLHLRMWAAISRPARRPLVPRIPHDAIGYGKFGRGQLLSYERFGAAHDEGDLSPIRRRPPNVIDRVKHVLLGAVMF